MIWFWWRWRWWWYGGDDFSVCYEHANVFWELRTNQACGKGHGPPHCKLSNNKDCCCAADFCAAPRNSRAETTKFRKRLKTRGTWEPRGGIEAQFSKFAISKIFHQYRCYAHQYWWMLRDDVWYEQANRNLLLEIAFDGIFSRKNNCDKFDRVTFKNFWHHIMMTGHIVSVDV